MWKGRVPYSYSQIHRRWLAPWGKTRENPKLELTSKEKLMQTLLIFLLDDKVLTEPRNGHRTVFLAFLYLVPTR